MVNHLNPKPPTLRQSNQNEIPGPKIKIVNTVIAMDNITRGRVASGISTSMLFESSFDGSNANHTIQTQPMKFAVAAETIMSVPRGLKTVLKTTMEAPKTYGIKKIDLARVVRVILFAIQGRMSFLVVWNTPSDPMTPIIVRTSLSKKESPSNLHTDP